MPARGTGKKVMTKAQKAKLRAKSGAAVTQAELARFARIKKALKKITPMMPAGTGGGVVGAKAGANLGKLYKGKVAKMIGAAGSTFGGGGLAGAHKRAMEAAKKRNKALKRRK